MYAKVQKEQGVKSKEDRLKRDAGKGSSSTFTLPPIRKPPIQD